MMTLSINLYVQFLPSVNFNLITHALLHFTFLCFNNDAILLKLDNSEHMIIKFQYQLKHVVLWIFAMQK